LPKSFGSKLGWPQFIIISAYKTLVSFAGMMYLYLGTLACYKIFWTLKLSCSKIQHGLFFVSLMLSWWNYNEVEFEHQLVDTYTLCMSKRKEIHKNLSTPLEILISKRKPY